jgi:hypothetical protein
VGIRLLCSTRGRSRLKSSFSKFGYNGQETDWPVGGKSLGRFPRLKDGNDLCNFPLVSEVVKEQDGVE